MTERTETKLYLRAPGQGGLGFGVYDVADVTTSDTAVIGDFEEVLHSWAILLSDNSEATTTESGTTVTFTQAGLVADRLLLLVVGV